MGAGRGAAVQREWAGDGVPGFGRATSSPPAETAGPPLPAPRRHPPLLQQTGGHCSRARRQPFGGPVRVREDHLVRVRCLVGGVVERIQPGSQDKQRLRGLAPQVEYQTARKRESLPHDPRPGRRITPCQCAGRAR